MISSWCSQFSELFTLDHCHSLLELDCNRLPLGISSSCQRTPWPQIPGPQCSSSFVRTMTICCCTSTQKQTSTQPHSLPAPTNGDSAYRNACGYRQMILSFKVHKLSGDLPRQLDIYIYGIYHIPLVTPNAFGLNYPNCMSLPASSKT